MSDHSRCITCDAHLRCPTCAPFSERVVALEKALSKKDAALRAAQVEATALAEATVMLTANGRLSTEARALAETICGRLAGEYTAQRARVADLGAELERGAAVRAPGRHLECCDAGQRVLAALNGLDT